MHWTGYISHPYLHTVHSTSAQLLTIYVLILKLEIGRLNSANILKIIQLNISVFIYHWNHSTKISSVLPNAKENYTTSNMTSVLTPIIHMKTVDKIKLDSVPEGFYIFDELIFDGTFKDRPTSSWKVFWASESFQSGDITVSIRSLLLNL